MRLDTCLSDVAQSVDAAVEQFERRLDVSPFFVPLLTVV